MDAMNSGYRTRWRRSLSRLLLPRRGRLQWVRADDEEEIRTAFQKSLEVSAKGAEAKELADLYFFETLVRIHRAGEGAPYTGLKPGEAVDPAVALADRALETGSVDRLVNDLTEAMANGIRERFGVVST